MAVEQADLPTWNFVINGEQRSVSVPGDTPLLWVIREEIGLKGTKFGCGMGLCGACTVHVAGQATRSCITPVSAVVGQAVLTIEGLASSSGGSLHPVQEAWTEGDVPQCGYCQSGQILAAAALLAGNPQPTSEEVRSFMAGNLCRCGSYPEIEKAIAAAAARLQQGTKP